MGLEKRGNKSGRLTIERDISHSGSEGNAVGQKTLNGRISCSGIALHSGSLVTMSLCPAEPDTGIVFVRTDLDGDGARILARWDNVVCTRLCTTVGNSDGLHVATIEHLMAALYGIGIDNAVVELNGPEVPIMDGSAAPFMFLVECAGTVEQNAPRRAIRILKSISVSDEHGGRAKLMPDDKFLVDIEIDFNNAAVARQSLAMELVNGTFKKELSRARTFGFLHEVEKLRAAGLARGGSLDNAVVISGNQILNEGGLRYGNEFVRHKALDAVGDLYLAGCPLIGAFQGFRSGHSTNNKVLRALFSDPGAWCYDVLMPDHPVGGVAPFESFETSLSTAVPA